MTFKILREIGRRGQKTVALRSIAEIFSKVRCDIRSGGLKFISDQDIFTKILNETGRKEVNGFDFYVGELVENETLARQFTNMCIKYGATKYRSWEEKISRFPGNVAIYYALVREVCPRVVVETGTATGSMTSYILAALNKNNIGRLISIDIPPVSGQLTMDISLSEGDIGYWIPDSYKDRWRYLVGDAKLLLPRVLVDEQVDFFVHDSLHTRSHMMFEYSVARALMSAGSIIASDDVLWNNSFDDFLMTNRLRGYAPFSNPNLGIVVNTFDKFETDEGLNIIRR